MVWTKCQSFGLRTDVKVQWSVSTDESRQSPMIEKPKSDDLHYTLTTLKFDAVEKIAL